MALGLIDLCKEGDFVLAKFMSNSKAVLAAIPEHLRGPKVKSLDDDLPVDKALGVVYDAEVDEFRVRTQKMGGILSNRKEALAAVMAIFDPIGIVGPFVLTGKKLNQRLCTLKIGWNDSLPPDVALEFQKWYDDIPLLGNIAISRWIGLASENDSVTLHTFCDASFIGYGAVSYVIVDRTSQVFWLHAKNRVSPMKEMEVDVGENIPRLELQGAVIAIQLVTQILEEMGLKVSRTVYYTDSTTVYWQIQSEDRKFKIFVANRLNKILLVSRKEQWRTVPSDLNPADVLSRGAKANDAKAWKLFHEGPPFLHLPES